MTPIFSISVDGNDVTGNFNDRLLELELTDNAGKESDQVTIRLDDRDFAITLPERGTKISFAIGYAETGLVDKGVFEVSDTSGRGHPREVTVHAKSASQRDDQKSQRTKNHKDKSLSDVATDVAGNHGLQPSVDDSFSDLKWDTLNQADESDWHLLGRMARMYDATFAVKNGSLIFTQSSSGQNASGASLPTLLIGETDLITYEFSSGDRPKHKAVEASWYDRKTGKRKRERVDLSDNGTEGSAPAATHRIRHLHHDQNHAKRAAKGKGDKLQRAEASVSVEISGDPTVAAEGNMVIDVGRPGLDGEWIVKTVVHTFNEDQVYTTKISGEAKSQGSSDSSSGGAS